MNGPVRWAANGPEYRVEERCGNDAVVVSYPVGKGEAIWWSSPMPLTNAGIREDASLALVLASLGPARAGDGRRIVLFDEYLHEQRESIGDTLAGLPWWPLAGQLAAVGLLLVLSFGRRSGPMRLPVRVPRTSPVEFAESMGRLYQRANATEAAVEAARAEMMRYLAESCGVSHEVLRREPAEIAGALEGRFGGDWGALGEHLAAAQPGNGVATGRQALRLVQALEEDQRRLRELVSARGLVRVSGG
jgi:ribosomal protein L16/L10AE